MHSVEVCGVFLSYLHGFLRLKLHNHVVDLALSPYSTHNNSPLWRLSDLQTWKSRTTRNHKGSSSSILQLSYQHHANLHTWTVATVVVQWVFPRQPSACWSIDVWLCCVLDFGSWLGSVDMCWRLCCERTRIRTAVIRVIEVKLLPVFIVILYQRGPVRCSCTVGKLNSWTFTTVH